MSTNRSRRIDRDTAEQLLGGAVAGTPAGPGAHLAGADRPTGADDGAAHPVLAGVLAAAAAPATEDELAGEEAAVAAFREARLAPVPQPTAPDRRRPMATAALARASRALSTKAVAAVLAATALGGVAVAAGTGNLPAALGGGSDEPTRPSYAPSVLAPVPGGPGTVGGTSDPLRSAGPSSGAASAGGVLLPAEPRSLAGGAPSAALLSLCQAFTDRTGKGERPRTLAGDPRFAPLADAAGGAEKVEGYCGAALRRPGDDGRQGATPLPHGGADDSGSKGTAGTGTGTGTGSNGTGSNGSGTGGTGSGRTDHPAATPDGSTPKADRSGKAVTGSTEQVGDSPPEPSPKR